MRRWVTHTPRWEPADLRVDAAGNTRPGFVCVYQLENGNGQCGGSTFRIEDAIGDHACIVEEESRLMIRGTIEFSGRTEGDVELAIETALESIRRGNTSGFDRNDSGSYTFQLTEEE